MEVVLRCENDVQVDALTVVDFHNALCGHAPVVFRVCRPQYFIFHTMSQRLLVK